MRRSSGWKSLGTRSVLRQARFDCDPVSAVHGANQLDRPLVDVVPTVDG
jgi:hypothetical protein